MKVRRNRTDPSPEGNAIAAAVLAQPRLYTRAYRRSIGYRLPAWADLMREYHSETLVLPRIVRRHFKATQQNVNSHRNRRLRTRMARALARYGRAV